MKKSICLLLVCMLLGACACAEGLLPSLEEVYGVPMPSLYTLLERYPDAYVETETGVEETWENVTDADFSAFGELLSASGCEMLNYTSENGLFDAEVGKPGQTYRFIYDAVAKRGTLIFPAGAYDEALYETEQDYQRAKALMDAGEYSEACVLLLKISGYRDVDGILESNENLREAVWTTPGSIVTFGAYEQDNDMDNGQEPIKWVVLSSDGNTSILISQYALDCKPFNNEKVQDVTWETCTLRKWLNGEFLNTAFSAEEQARLETTTVTADKNPKYSTDPGNNTQDKVFLLSIEEAKRYFDSNSARVCMPTEMAISNGVNTDAFGACRWWLRSPGNNNRGAAGVYATGSIDTNGNSVRLGYYAVRPVVVFRLS